METENLIKQNDWVVAANRKKLREGGIEVGQIMWVTALKALPAKKSDPYVQRVYVLAMKWSEENGLEVPSESTDYKIYLIDPRNLTKLSQEEQTQFNLMLQDQFKQPGVEDAEVIEDEVVDEASD